MSNCLTHHQNAENRGLDKLDNWTLTLVVLAALAVSASAATVRAPFSGIPETYLTFDVEGGSGEWLLMSSSEQAAHYVSGSVSLGLKLEKSAAQTILHVQLKAPVGQKVAVKSYSARVVLPKTGLHAVMVPNQHKIARLLDYWGEHHKWPENVTLYRNLVTENFKQAAPTNAEAPFILVTDSNGINKVAVGWAAAERGSALEGAVEGEAYVLTLERREDVPFEGQGFKDALIFDMSERPWIDVEEDYARAFDRYNGRKHEPLPEWATEPVYCTWYCYGDKITQDGVLKIAQKCKELGFGTILIDAGWDCHPNGGYIDFENGILGDYIARPDRFPDMPGLVKQIHDMGLRVMLWCAPFWEGKKSRAYQEKTSSWHMRDADGNVLHELCPKHPEVRKHFFDRFAWIAKTYDIDGMWIDAADAVRGTCYADHPHTEESMGHAFVECLAAVRGGLRSVKPDAITEARVMHANLNTKVALDVVQPSDAPYSYEVLRLAGIHLRPWAYDLQVKNDPMIWGKKADAATVGKFLATMVCSGVPALSVDFLTASEEHCALTKAWLNFYKEHKETLLRGKFALFGEDFGSPDMMLVGREETVLYVKNPATRKVQLPKAVKRITILNCTDADRVQLTISPVQERMKARAYRPDWSPAGEDLTIESGSVDCVVPQGGALIMEAQ
ncbi:MAG: alpha-galactosidase [Armatimonadota bacterium]|nr:alpha-galactosidase [Armatimonadota bacterium]